VQVPSDLLNFLAASDSVGGPEEETIKEHPLDTLWAFCKKRTQAIRKQFNNRKKGHTFTVAKLVPN
jgi:hypothetical protein